MKSFAAVAVAALIALPLSAAAQTAGATQTKAVAKAPVKAQAKPATKPKAQQAKKSAAPAAAAAAAATAAAAAAVVLTDTDLAVAKNVHTGRIPCELGADVTVTPDTKREGFFHVATKGASYYMHPVESRTGAIRLEDNAAGAIWLQLGNKSMLMNQKQGVRIADECQNEAQVAVANDLKLNPPKSLLDDPTPSK